MDKIKYFINVLWNNIWHFIIALMMAVLTIFFFLMIFVAIFADHSMSEFLISLVVTAVLALITWLFINSWFLKPYRCPSCLRNFALKGCGIEEVGNEQSIGNETSTSYVNTKADTNTVFGSVDVKVPVTQTNTVAYNQKVYQRNYVCRFCGEECYKTFKGDKTRA
jgi:hypothetical protein